MSPASAVELEAAADRLYLAGQFEQALTAYIELLRYRSGDANLHFKLASAAWGAEQLNLAEQHFRAAVEADPAHADAHERLALLYVGLDQIDAALKQVRIARQLQPNNGNFALTEANALDRSGRWQEAWDILKPLLARQPLHPQAANLYARLAPRVNEREQAAVVIDRVLERDDVPSFERSRLAFAGCKLLESMGQYDRAFALARLGNELANRPHDPAITEARVERQIRHCTRKQLRSLPRATHDSHRPVFIVGMPRSGTSLVEQIVSAHPNVYGAGELPEIPRMVEAMSRRSSYPECLDTYSLNTFNRMAREYLGVLDRLNADARYVTDKLPLNCLYLDLIQLLFPDCHVIHCMRDPMDTCLSCYMTGFSVAHGFACDLKKLGAFYREYERLMSHWRSVLDIPMLDVQYEQLVDDVEGQSRRILDFLGLEWDERCLRFFENKRPVTTASRDQVTRPIYQSSVGRWKQYEQHLGDLISSLGLAGASDREDLR